MLYLLRQIDPPRSAWYHTGMQELEKELAKLLNRNCIDTRLNMPDWVIAQIIVRLLDSIAEAREIESRQWAKKPS